MPQVLISLKILSNTYREGRICTWEAHAAAQAWLSTCARGACWVYCLTSERAQNMPPKACHLSVRMILSSRQLRCNRWKNSALSHPLLPKSRACVSIYKAVPHQYLMPGEIQLSCPHKQLLLKIALSSHYLHIYLLFYSLTSLEAQILFSFV